MLLADLRTSPTHTILTRAATARPHPPFHFNAPEATAPGRDNVDRSHAHDAPRIGPSLRAEAAIELGDPSQREKHRVGDDKSGSREARRAEKRLQKLRLLAEREEMKFSHSIQFNAVPDWSNNYISYSNLKKLIYTLEKQINRVTDDGQDEEQNALLGGQQFDPDTVFRRMLDSELDRVCSFYRLKELEIYGEVGSLIKEQETYENETQGLDMEDIIEGENRRKAQRSNSIFNVLGGRKRRTSTMSASIEEEIEAADDSDSDAEEASPLKRKPSMKQRSKSAWDASANNHHRLADSGEDLRSSSTRDGSSLLKRRRPSLALELDHDDPAQLSALYDSGITLKKRTVSLYVSLCELKSFIQLNQTGFKKAAKKYDKVCNRNIRKDYMEKVVNPAYPFRDTTTTHLDANIAKVEKIYADVVTKGDVPSARRELRLHLREHVVWERNTVWREMIGIERKAQAANFGIKQTLLGGNQDPSKTRLQGDDQNMETKGVQTPLGRYYCPRWLFSSTFFALIAIVAVFAVLLAVPIMKKPEQQNCLAMLVFVSLLWATEVIPLFVTSMLIPFLVVVLRILRSEEKPYDRLEPEDATKLVFAAMWTPVIMLLLGGFTIAAALSKYHIAKMMATFVLSKAGNKPRTVLITNMFVGMFLSMWISNVAAPVLCFSIIQPMLRNLPADSRFSKALILGIALASNIGGAASPIASPQNIIALENMRPNPSWGIWFFIALPVCIISILLIWLLLLITFQPGRGTTIVPIRPMNDRLNGIQYFIIGTTLVTIVLWCTSHQLEGVFGDMGVIAIIPLVLFFGTGILTKEDFNNFLWTIIILAAGGLCLGKAVASSGLLHTIASALTDRVSHLSIYGVLVVFASLILVVATFISHTVAALIILPLVQQVGQGMKEPHPNLLVMGSALMCSAAMGLPTSGFPNMSEYRSLVPASCTDSVCSCDYDGSAGNGAALSAGSTFPHAWHTGQYHDILGGDICRVWVDAGSWAVTSKRK